MSSQRKPIILIFVRYFLPGYKAGGPIRSVANLVSLLSSSYHFKIVCLDRDHGVDKPYSGIFINQWQKRDEYQVYYASPDQAGYRLAKKLYDEVKPDIIYFNSFFDKEFSIYPYFALRNKTQAPMVLTPRGELSPGALQIKPIRKKIFLFMVKCLGLYKKIRWHASSETEMQHIQNMFYPSQNHLCLASNVPEQLNTENRPKHLSKTVNQLKIVLVARISKMKNTIGAIQVVNKLKGNIEFDLWGPCEELEYWQLCLQEIAKSPANVKISYRGELEHQQIRTKLCNYDVFFMPSLGENFGHAIFEAFAAGLPVVTSDRTPWRNLQAIGVGADLSLDQSQLFLDFFNQYVKMNQEDFGKLHEKCYDFAIDWNIKNAQVDSYHHLFSQKEL